MRSPSWNLVIAHFGTTTAGWHWSNFDQRGPRWFYSWIQFFNFQNMRNFRCAGILTILLHHLLIVQWVVASLASLSLVIRVFAFHQFVRVLYCTWPCLCRFVCVSEVLQLIISFLFFHAHWIGSCARVHYDIHLFIGAWALLVTNGHECLTLLLVSSCVLVAFIYDHADHWNCSWATLVV